MINKNIASYLLLILPAYFQAPSAIGQEPTVSSQSALGVAIYV